MKFLKKPFPFFSVLLGRFLNQLPNKRQTHLLIATRQTQLLTSKYESHCRRTCLSLAKNTFVLGTNTLALEMNVLKTCVQAPATHTHTHIHIHTASYQQLSSRIYVEMTGAITLRRSKRYLGAQQRFKQIEKTIVELLLTHSCTCSVVWVWLDCMCHIQNN